MTEIIRKNTSWKYAVWFPRCYCCTESPTEGFSRKYKTTLSLLEEATFISQAIWHSLWFQKNICLHFVIKEHQIVENIHDNVQLEKDGISGKRKKFIAYLQRLKYVENWTTKLNRWDLIPKGTEGEVNKWSYNLYKIIVRTIFCGTKLWQNAYSTNTFNLNLTKIIFNNSVRPRCQHNPALLQNNSFNALMKNNRCLF